jgi:hypothetical protein
MSLYSQEDIRQLQHCIYLTFLHSPRLYYDRGAKHCGTVRNTFTKYWRKGLNEKIFFPPQIRLKMYENRKEYIYLVQSDKVHELYDYYENHLNVIYLAYTLGKFDLLIQTDKPLDVIPSNTILYGSRSNYIFPEIPYYSFETAFEKMKAFLNLSHETSRMAVEYPKEPEIKGVSFGQQVFPYLKYNLRPNYTSIVRKLGISFTSFYKGFEYLLKVSTVLLPYYPLGFHQYSQHFFVFWTDYEDLLCELFGYLPCYVSITNVSDALLIYASILRDGMSKYHFFRLYYDLLKQGYVNKFWTATPVFHWRPDP